MKPQREEERDSLDHRALSDARTRWIAALLVVLLIIGLPLVFFWLVTAAGDGP